MTKSSQTAQQSQEYSFLAYAKEVREFQEFPAEFLLRVNSSKTYCLEGKNGLKQIHCEFADGNTCKQVNWLVAFDAPISVGQKVKVRSMRWYASPNGTIVMCEGR